MQRSRSLLHLAAAAILATSTPAAALTIDFEDFDHGDIVANGSASYRGYTLTVHRDDGEQEFDVATAFDTGVTGTRDPDLEQGAGYDFGNLGPFPDLGNILILQENEDCTETNCALPDDFGRGELWFDLDDTFESFAFDLIDVQEPFLHDGWIEFRLGDAEVAFYRFIDFLCHPFFQEQGIAFGDHSANRIDLGDIGPFDSFHINMGGSGGIDDLVLGGGDPIPEPGTAALLGLGLAGLAFARRRPIA